MEENLYIFTVGSEAKQCYKLQKFRIFNVLTVFFVELTNLGNAF